MHPASGETSRFAGRFLSRPLHVTLRPMISFRIRVASALTAAVAAMSFAAPGQAALVSISGGTGVSSIPQGNSGNIVLEQAGIGLAGGQIWVDGTLDNLSDEMTLTLYDVGSESHWRNQIRLGNTSGKLLRDNDDHRNYSTGWFVNGPPFQRVGSVTQNSGVANFQFWAMNLDPDVMIVANGQSPMMMVPGYGYASIALAYLSDTNQIVSGPTNRILFLLEDGGKDRDYDDYVGILEITD